MYSLEAKFEHNPLLYIRDGLRIEIPFFFEKYNRTHQNISRKKDFVFF